MLQACLQTISGMGNPFLDDFQDLVRLDSGNWTDDSVIKTVLAFED